MSPIHPTTAPPQVTNLNTKAAQDPLPSGVRHESELPNSDHSQLNAVDTSLALLQSIQPSPHDLTLENQLVDQERQALTAKVKTSCIMIVDDEEVNVLTVRQHLVRAGYDNFVTTTDSCEAVQLAAEKRPDLILLDIHMPKVNGLQILNELANNPWLKNIPVVILTAASDPKIKQVALELGANDFLTKPVDPNELAPRVRNALVLKAHFDQLASQKNDLEQIVKKRTDELYQSRQQLILSLARAAEHRDNETGNHVLRVGCYAGVIAKQMGWANADIEMLQQAAQLHDVGKIGVPDQILLKPGKLDAQEYALMRTHCAMGKDIIAPFAAGDLEVYQSHTEIGENILHVHNSPLMTMATRVAQTHHEHWDGSGYPIGLAGEDIPIEGRITSVADVFDALSSKRAYKDPFPRQKCFDILEKARGTQFDPDVVDAFFACSAKIVEIQIALMDT